MELWAGLRMAKNNVSKEFRGAAISGDDAWGAVEKPYGVCYLAF
jgi:hypothetical protein